MRPWCASLALVVAGGGGHGDDDHAPSDPVRVACHDVWDPASRGDGCDTDAVLDLCETAWTRTMSSATARPWAGRDERTEEHGGRTETPSTARSSPWARAVHLHVPQPPAPKRSAPRSRLRAPWFRGERGSTGFDATAPARPERRPASSTCSSRRHRLAELGGSSPTEATTNHFQRPPATCVHILAHLLCCYIIGVPDVYCCQRPPLVPQT